MTNRLVHFLNDLEQVCKTHREILTKELDLKSDLTSFINQAQEPTPTDTATATATPPMPTPSAIPQTDPTPNESVKIYGEMARTWIKEVENMGAMVKSADTSMLESDLTALISNLCGADYARYISRPDTNFPNSWVLNPGAVEVFYNNSAADMERVLNQHPHLLPPG